MFFMITETKPKGRILVGRKIMQLMRNSDFERSLNKCEAVAWESFKNVVKNFLGNEKSEYYKQLVSDILQKYRGLGCNMSLKIFWIYI